MTHYAPFAIEGEVFLNNIPLKVIGAIEYGMVNIHGRKVNQGDPGPDDHPVNSTWITSDTTGGGQVREGNPASDQNRFWWSTADTSRPNQITLSPYTHSFDPPSGASGASFAIGDFVTAGEWEFYAAWGDTLCRLTDGEFLTVDTLGGFPVSRGVVFVPQTGGTAGTPFMYIAHGSGYDRFDGSTVTTFTDDAIAFEVWDNKLFKLSADGHLVYNVDGTNTWEEVGTSGIWVPDGFTPRRLVSFYDRNGDAALHVVTNGGAYALDYDAAVLRKMELEFPVHPHQGRAAAKWRGDLYISVGLGVHRTDGSLISSTGPDNRNGLPAEYVGTIVDFAPGYNDLFALIQGVTTVEDVEQTEQVQTGMTDLDFYTGATSANCLLLANNGFGWHYRWHQNGGVPSNVLTAMGDGYSLWWGVGNQLFRQKLPISYFNPLDSPGGEFAEVSEFESYWHNWGWKGQPKIFKAIELSTKNCSATETVEVFYKVDRDDNPWVYVGVIESDGEFEFRIGLTHDGEYIGAQHERLKIRLRLRRRSGDLSKRPVVEWFSVVGRKFLRPQRTWRFRCSLEDQNHGYPSGWVSDELERMVLTPTSYRFSYGTKDFTVDVVSLNGPDMPGDLQKGLRAISLIESFEAART